MPKPRKLLHAHPLPNPKAGDPPPVQPVVSPPNPPPHRNRTLRHDLGLPCKCKACKGTKKTLHGGTGEGGEALVRQSPPPARPAHIVLKDDGIIYADVAQDDRVSTTKRERVGRFLELRAGGMERAEIAVTMGMNARYLNSLVRDAVKEGWLVFTDPLERFHERIVPKVVENIEHFINLKDRTMTIEAAKGAGIFKSHQAIKTESDTPTTVLALKIETIPSSEIKVATGAILGVAREVE